MQNVWKKKQEYQTPNTISYMKWSVFECFIPFPRALFMLSEGKLIISRFQQLNGINPFPKFSVTKKTVFICFIKKGGGLNMLLNLQWWNLQYCDFKIVQKIQVKLKAWIFIFPELRIGSMISSCDAKHHHEPPLLISLHLYAWMSHALQHTVLLTYSMLYVRLLNAF